MRQTLPIPWKYPGDICSVLPLHLAMTPSVANTVTNINSVWLPSAHMSVCVITLWIQWGKDCTFSGLYSSVGYTAWLSIAFQSVGESQRTSFSDLSAPSACYAHGSHEEGSHLKKAAMADEIWTMHNATLIQKSQFAFQSY